MMTIPITVKCVSCYSEGVANVEVKITNNLKLKMLYYEYPIPPGWTKHQKYGSFDGARCPDC